jgi:shikimate kinase
VLLGLMGSGKSTVGRGLARALKRPIRDSDADIERTHGLTAREMAERDGIEALHDLECRVLLDALADPVPAVIAAAASTVEHPACRSALGRTDVRAIWLRGDPEVLAARISSKDHRPDFGDDQVEVIREQAARRHPLFEAVAGEVVDVDDRAPDEIVADVTR